MSPPESPLRRSIGLHGTIRWLIALAAVIAIGGAIDAGHYGLAAAGCVFLVAAVALGYRAWKSQDSAADRRSP